MSSHTRSALLATLGVLVLSGCSRANEQPQPKAVAERAADAAAPSPISAADAGVTAQPPASPLSIVARGPMTTRLDGLMPHETAAGFPAMQRLPNGGLAVASEYARAIASGPGPLAVDLHGRGFERDIAYRSGEIQGAQAVRWVWSEPSLTIVSNEEATMRSGPRVTSYKLGAKGWEVTRGSSGFWSAVATRGAVLALERVAYEIPNSSAYPKGSEYYHNSYGYKPARVAVLGGATAAPIVPPNVCPTVMSAAADGTIAIGVRDCSEWNSSEGRFGALVYPPGQTKTKPEWFTPPAEAPDKAQGPYEPTDITISVGGANDVAAGVGDRLERWDGKAWTSSSPGVGKIASLSHGVDGSLWATTTTGRLVKRGPDGARFGDVPLPAVPSDPLEDAPYGAPGLTGPAHFERGGASELEVLRGAVKKPMMARVVDAAGEEVLVLASTEREALFLSTRARAPVARLPSIPTQRATLLMGMKPEMRASSKAACFGGYLMFPDGVTAETLHAKLGTSPTDAGADDGIGVGEAIVEGQRKLVVFGVDSLLEDATKQLASLSPRRACTPAVIDRRR